MKWITYSVPLVFAVISGWCAYHGSIGALFFPIFSLVALALILCVSD